MKEKYVVELQPGCWIAPWDGDPGRTLVRVNAMTFATQKKAESALMKARSYRPFENAKIYIPKTNPYETDI